MKSALPKVLHPLAGAPVIDYVLRTAAALSPASRTIVVGHGADRVREALAGHADLRFVVQEPQLGTAHAVAQAAPLLEGATGTLLLLYGDVPRLSADTSRALLDEHHRSGNAATVLTALVDDPSGYGRVLRDDRGIARIVEHRDATGEERAIREINSGIYAFDLEPLFGRPLARRRRQRPGRVLPDRPRGHLPRRQPPRGGAGRRAPRRDPRHQRPQRAGRHGQADLARARRAADGRRRHPRGPRHHLRGRRRRHRPRHHHPPRGHPRGADDHRLRLRHPPRRPHHRQHHRRQRRHPGSLRGRRRANCRARPGRPLCPDQAGNRGRAERPDRQLRRVEEDAAGGGLEGDAPGLPRATPRSART